MVGREHELKCAHFMILSPWIFADRALRLAITAVGLRSYSAVYLHHGGGRPKYYRQCDATVNRYIVGYINVRVEQAIYRACPARL